MFGDAPRSPFTGVPGWETQPEQQVLMLYASQVPNGGIIVEIGGEFGQSASLFAKAADPSVDIFTFDLFPGDLQVQHLSNLAEAGFKGRTHAIKANSREAAGEWTTITTSNIDLLFVDGDHTYEGALGDATLWWPHLKKDGFIIFHDSTPPTNTSPHPLHHEVNKAIEQWLEDTRKQAEWVEQTPVGTMRIFRLMELYDVAPPQPESKSKKGTTKK